MENNFVMVRSASDWQLVMDVPHLNLHRVWTKSGQQYPIERMALIQAYYQPAVEALFIDGSLVTDDRDFLREVGLLDEECQASRIYELTDNMKMRLIKLMPVSEVKKELAKMSPSQIAEVADFAIVNYESLVMDRIDLLSEASGRDIMKAITNYKAAKEG